MQNPYKDFKYESFLNRPSAIHRDLITRICNKLYETHKITYFLFQRRFKNFVLLELTNNHQWAMRYCTEYICYDSFRNHSVLTDKEYYIWGVEVTSQKEKDMHAERTELYKIPAGVTFIKTKDIFTDTYSFSSSLSTVDGIYSLLKIKKDLIEFGDQFAAQIEFILSEKKITSDTFNIKLIDKNITKDDFRPKEIKILSLLASDYDTNQIANIIHLTSKSVQKIIDSLKERIHCETRTGLIAKAISKNLIDGSQDKKASPIILL